MKYDWKYTKMEVSFGDMDKFEFLRNRRKLNNGNVTRLRRLLVRGEHFETPMVANLKNGKLRLIDGNHRIEAITQFLEKNKTVTIEIAICYYEDLPEQEESEKFAKWNAGMKQSRYDFIQINRERIPIINKLKKSEGFPVTISIYPAVKQLDVRMLLEPYLKVKEGLPISGNILGGITGWIDKVKDMGEEEAKELAQFVEEYTEVFGPVDKKNPHFKKAVFQPIATIWFKNRGTVPPEKMKKQLLKLRCHERVMYWCTMPSFRGNLAQAYKDFLDVINGSRVNNRFQ